MTTLNGHFDGKHIVLDDPAPADLRPNTPVKVIVETNGSPGLFDRIAELAVPDEGLPRDFAAQHDHYVKGTPRQ